MQSSFTTARIDLNFTGQKQVVSEQKCLLTSTCRLVICSPDMCRLLYYGKNTQVCISCRFICQILSFKSGCGSYTRPSLLADRFREHLRDSEQNNTDASKPVARHFNLPNHSHHNMTICGLSLHHGNTESRKNLEQKLIFQLGTLSPHEINERLSFH